MCDQSFFIVFSLPVNEVLLSLTSVYSVDLTWVLSSICCSAKLPLANKIYAVFEKSLFLLVAIRVMVT